MCFVLRRSLNNADLDALHLSLQIKKNQEALFHPENAFPLQECKNCKMTHTQRQKEFGNQAAPHKERPAVKKDEIRRVKTRIPQMRSKRLPQQTSSNTSTE